MAPTSGSFLEEKPEEVRLIAQVAQTFGQWPSTLLTMQPILRRFNLAAAETLWKMAIEQAKARE
jgi:hypothetical protein